MLAYFCLCWKRSQTHFLVLILPKAAFRALRLTLQLVASLHDIVAYLFSFAKLGNCPTSFELPQSPSPWTGDWRGLEGIGK